MSHPWEDKKDADSIASHDSDAIATASAGEAGTAGANLGQDADVGSLIHAALLDSGSANLGGGLGDIGSDDAGLATGIYDAHIPLVLDSGILPAIDATLDLLTTSTDLFDVPSFDFGHVPGDTGDA